MNKKITWITTLGAVFVLGMLTTSLIPAAQEAEAGTRSPDLEPTEAMIFGVSHVLESQERRLVGISAFIDEHPPDPVLPATIAIGLTAIQAQSVLDEACAISLQLEAAQPPDPC